MEILKNTFLLTAFYIIFAFLLILVGAWREHVYREKSTAQQERMGEQNGELIRLVHEIYEMQESQDKNFTSVVQNLYKSGIISDKTADAALSLSGLEIKSSQGNINATTDNESK